MPRTQSQRALARRAAAQDDRLPEAVRLRSGVINAGLATLAVSVLGLGVAASAMSTSSAQDTHVATATAPVVTTVAPGVKQPSAFQRDATTISRSNFRAALSSSEQSDALDAAGSDRGRREGRRAGRGRRARPSRAGQPCWPRSHGRRRSGPTKLEKKKEAAKKAAKKKAEAAKKALGIATMPVKSYSIAARFGDVGAWARYHTGFDFSAPIGTPIYAPTAGVVVHAGSGGKAAGWAGNYVVIKHADGTQTLYAHMSSISVQSGANGDRRDPTRPGRSDRPRVRPPPALRGLPGRRRAGRRLQRGQPAAVADQARTQAVDTPESLPPNAPLDPALVRAGRGRGHRTRGDEPPAGGRFGRQRRLRGRPRSMRPGWCSRPVRPPRSPPRPGPAGDSRALGFPVPTGGGGSRLRSRPRPALPGARLRGG